MNNYNVQSPLGPERKEGETLAQYLTRTTDQTGEGNVPRKKSVEMDEKPPFHEQVRILFGLDSEQSSNAPRETIQEREYKRLYLEASAERDELLAAATRVLSDNAWDLERNTQSGSILISLDVIRQLKKATEAAQ
jgi:hypothetical protein